MRKIGLLLLSSLLWTAPAFAQDAVWADDPNMVPIAPENVLVLSLETGTVIIEMFPDIAPGHVERIRTLATQGFYDDVIFHRVIDGFMAQGGDPTGTGQGGSDLPDLQAEFSPIPHRRGTLSMARAREPNSANSQFFIMFADTSPSGQNWSQLDSSYTIWGRVIEGMEHVDAVHMGEPPEDPTEIVRARTIATEFPGTQFYPGPPQSAERIAHAHRLAQEFDALFETDVQIDILSPVLRTQ